MKIRVYYEDTDAGGVVYHSNYLNFCERARSEVFYQHGLSPHQEDAFFVVKNISANYIKSAKLGDILEVKTEVLNIKKASVVLQQTIFKDQIKLFQMDVTLVYLSFNKPSKIPEDFLSLFESL